MYYRKLHAFTRKTLRGRYLPAFGTALAVSSVRLLLWGIPMLTAAMLTAIGAMTPQALFLGRSRMWGLFSLFWGMAAFMILLPIRCGVWRWFAALLGMGRQERYRFRSADAFFRAVYFFGSVSLMRFAALAPLIAACLLTVAAFRQSIMASGGIWLFAAVQGMAAACWLLWGYLRFCIGLAAVPFLYLEDPAVSPSVAVRHSVRMLSGYRRHLLVLIGSYLPGMLLGITIPFLLPYLFADVTLFLQLRMREYQQDADGRG